MVASPLDGAEFTAPANILISASASDLDGQIRQIVIFANPDVVFAYPALFFETTNSSFGFLWTNVLGGYYYLNFSATDDVGAHAGDSRAILVHPENDAFTNATPIRGAPLSVAGSNAGADKETGEPNHAGQSGGNSIWLSWTPTSNGPVTILCNLTNQWGSIWPLLGVYAGSTITTLSSVASNAPLYGNTAVVSFWATVGKTYKIAVDAYGWGNVNLQFIPTAAPIVAITNPPNNATFIGPTDVQISAQASDSDGSIARVEFYADGSLIGTCFVPPYSVVWSNVEPADYSRELVAYAVDNAGVGVFSAPVYVTIQPPTPPPNDMFADRITISGTNVTVSGTNIGATQEADEPFHWDTTGGKSVWWTWQAPTSSTVTITTAGSSFDTILAVYDGDAIENLSLMANNDDYDGITSQVTFFASAGIDYQIAVDGYGGASGDISLSVSQP
jgi:hypothetical protein